MAKVVLKNLRPQKEAASPLPALIKEVRTHRPRADVKLLERAFELADQAHSGQLRKSGDPFISHPLGVAEILAALGLDERTVAAALLHDAVEDTGLTLDRVITDFGQEVATLVDGVTKLDRVRFDTREAQQAATIRKMLVAMAKDLRS